MTRIDALKLIEDFLEGTAKEEDDGVEKLSNVWVALLKLDTIPSTPVPTPSWKKELKISGQIGDPKSQLSFVSLVRQIETAVIKKYTETEIIEAVLKAILPGSNLRSYLECRQDLDLPQLKKIIRAHYKEKNATELYQELSNVAQSAKEDPTEFLMRALGLRQKVLFASTEKGAGLTYSVELVNGMFKHAVYTGFLDDSIRHEILPTLEEKDVTDEKLIETLNKIYLMEKERKVKLGKSRSQVMSVQEADKEEKSPKPVKEGVFLTEQRELKAEVMELKKSMNSNNDTSETQKNVQWKGGCETCRAEGKEKMCQHCWRCGSSEHFRRGCRAKLSENGKGLQK